MADSQNQPEVLSNQCTDRITLELKLLSPEERLIIFNEFCVHCGWIQTNPICRCWDDS